MSALQQHEIRRRSDGSIDVSHYAMAASRLRSEARNRMAGRLLGWLGRTIHKMLIARETEARRRLRLGR